MQDCWKAWELLWSLDVTELSLCSCLARLSPWAWTGSCWEPHKALHSSAQFSSGPLQTGEFTFRELRIPSECKTVNSLCLNALLFAFYFLIRWTCSNVSESQECPECGNVQAGCVVMFQLQLRHRHHSVSYLLLSTHVEKYLERIWKYGDVISKCRVSAGEEGERRRMMFLLKDVPDSTRHQNINNSSWFQWRQQRAASGCVSP